jgi:hypothetical protein
MLEDADDTDTPMKGGRGEAGRSRTSGLSHSFVAWSLDDIAATVVFPVHRNNVLAMPIAAA